MSHDNQGYSSGNRGSADKHGPSDNPYADSQHDSSQHPYADQADTDLEATTHRASVFGDAEQGYSGQEETNLSMPVTGSYPSSHSSASHSAAGNSAGYSAQAGYPGSHTSAATGYEHQGWGAPQHAPDQRWGAHQQAPDQTWAAHQQVPDQGWGTHQQADQTWAAQQQVPDQAWGGEQSQAGQQAWNAQQPQPPAEANVISALTDFSFTKMATPGLVKILYIAAAVLGLLQLVGFTFSAFTLGAQLGTIGVVLGVMGLIGGLVGLLVFVLAVRIYLEIALSVVRTSQDVRHLRSKFDEAD